MHEKITDNQSEGHFAASAQTIIAGGLQTKRLG